MTLFLLTVAGGFRPTTCENSEQTGNIQLSCRYLTIQDDLSDESNSS
jgi:hypothetical protein